MLPIDAKPLFACAPAVVAALALIGCSSSSSPWSATTNASLTPFHSDAAHDEDAEGDDDDGDAASEAATDDSATPDAPADTATADSPAQGDAGGADADDGACPCGVVDPYQCDELTHQCAQNPSCSSCQQLSQVCACAPCDDGGGHHCH
jgi:hypothetical protein